MLKVRHSNYYQQKLQNNYFQPKVLLLAQPLLQTPRLRYQSRTREVGSITALWESGYPPIKNNQLWSVRSQCTLVVES